jgi:hypothetical protein
MTSVLSGINVNYPFVVPSWRLSLICYTAVFADVMVEYFIRSRMCLLEGRSKHLCEIKCQIENLRKILDKFNENHPDQQDIHPAVTFECANLQKVLSILLGELNLESSTAEVVAISGGANI